MNLYLRHTLEHLTIIYIFRLPISKNQYLHYNRISYVFFMTHELPTLLSSSKFTFANRVYDSVVIFLGCSWML